jgi:hypothetical protein
MKQIIILWSGAFLITFLSVYFENILSPYYPTTGSIGINGQKVSYKFDKVFRGKENYTVMIRTDLPDLKGKLKWQKIEKKNSWNSVQMITGNGILYAEILKQPPKRIVKYEVELINKDSTYTLPQCEIQFLGAVPSMIMFLFYFSLFGGILLSTRTGMEYFNENQKIKKLSLFTITFFFVLAIAVTPLKKSYELEAINKTVPPITELFDYQSLLLLLLWLIGMAVVFKMKNPKPAALALSIITILIFLFISN